jgi:uncharacterized tellurite resistance protein B-like protein
MPDATTAPTSSALAKDIIAQIIAKVGAPNGFAKLSPPQRKFLLAAILSSIVPADGKIRTIEIARLESHLKSKYQMNAADLKQVLAMAGDGLSNDQVQLAASHLPDLLSIEDRTALVGMLWDIALCDEELHSAEAALVHKIGQNAGVARHRVTQQQAIAAGQNNKG